MVRMPTVAHKGAMGHRVSTVADLPAVKVRGSLSEVSLLAVSRCGHWLPAPLPQVRQQSAHLR
jgi:hypothetical protein